MVFGRLFVVASLIPGLAGVSATGGTREVTCEEDRTIAIQSILDESGIRPYEVRVDRFSVGDQILVENPEGCSSSQTSGFDCGDFRLDLAVLVTDDSGRSVHHSISRVNTGFVVTLEESVDMGAVTAYAGDAAVKDFSNSVLGEMRSPDLMSERDGGVMATRSMLTTQSYPGWTNYYYGVPSRYKYCPSSCTPKSLHDYCTWSPDGYGKANFRGPCANHDLAIDSIRKKAITLASKKNHRYAADDRFGTQLRHNCAYFSKPSHTSTFQCQVVANGYVVAVKAKTSTWNGR